MRNLTYEVLYLVDRTGTDKNPVQFSTKTTRLSKVKEMAIKAVIANEAKHGNTITKDNLKGMKIISLYLTH